ncbi:MAG: S-layer homology domain-containing protein, partial [Clostridiales bacterium]|nr:S-layer homology domain-containing protein [Clostridiales bacterium]
AWTYGTLNEKMQLHADLDDSGTAKQCKIYYGHAGSTKTVDFFYPTVNNDVDLPLYEKNGTIIDPEPESTVYKEVSALTAGGSYIIVANDVTADYAVKFQTVEGENYNVGAAAVTITDGAGYFDGGISLAGTDVIVTDNDSLMWIYDGNNEFLSTANSAYHLYGGKIDTKTGKSGDYTPGLYSVKLDRDCIYTAGHKMYSDGSSNYYHVLSGGKFDVTTAAENGSVIRLFREVDGSHGEPPADPGYPLATSIESGSTYVIVAKKDGNAYALTTGTGSEENTLSGAPVTVSDNKVSAAGVTDAMKWLFTADGNGYDVTNGSCYLNRKSGGGLLVKAEEDAAGYSDWIYDDDNRLYTYNHSTENYLYLSDGNPGCFSTDTSTDENITIYLYKVTGTPVDRVAVTDIAPPAAGAAPDTSAGTDIGTVRSVSWQPAVHGTFAGNTAYTVSVTLSVPEGYFFTSDTAAALNGQKAAPVLNADGTLTVSYRFPKTGAVHVIDYEPITPKKFFTDVKAGEWYYDAVKFVVNNGLFSGTSDMTFEPQTPMTRAMLMTVLYRREGSPAVSASNPFPDVPAGEWFTDAVLWARRNGVAAGYPDGTFRPDTNLTREQLAVFLCNYARYKGFDMARGDSFNLRIFGDAAVIPDYAGEAMKWACSVGLMRGKPGSLLAPKDNASRAEVAAILKRFVEGIED